MKSTAELGMACRQVCYAVVNGVLHVLCYVIFVKISVALEATFRILI